MTPNDDTRPPLPCGEGAGGEGRETVAPPAIKRVERRGHGWAPEFGEKRQKDFSRSNERAREMRREPTPAEEAMWKLLRLLNREGAHFRRQLALAHYVFDFGDYRARLLIEIDGRAHDDPEVSKRDALKEAHARKNGFRVLRLTNAEVIGRASWAIEQVRDALENSNAPSPLVGEGREGGRAGRCALPSSPPTPSPSPQGGGE
ncbi:MAG: hypothetical protein A4S17_13820 [Proteobacteria bacterium HN_bin10]|nr:MAG: hypothetical protein A4S17_13820 [Proteobacteria bacterium HN_bin10]